MNISSNSRNKRDFSRGVTSAKTKKKVYIY